MFVRDALFSSLVLVHVLLFGHGVARHTNGIRPFSLQYGLVAQLHMVMLRTTCVSLSIVCWGCYRSRLSKNHGHVQLSVLPQLLRFPYQLVHSYLHHAYKRTLNPDRETQQKTHHGGYREAGGALRCVFRVGVCCLLWTGGSVVESRTRAPVLRASFAGTQQGQPGTERLLSEGTEIWDEI